MHADTSHWDPKSRTVSHTLRTAINVSLRHFIIRRTSLCQLFIASKRVAAAVVSEVGWLLDRVALDLLMLELERPETLAKPKGTQQLLQTHTYGHRHTHTYLLKHTHADKHSNTQTHAHTGKENYIPKTKRTTTKIRKIISNTFLTQIKRKRKMKFSKRRKGKVSHEFLLQSVYHVDYIHANIHANNR